MSKRHSSIDSKLQRTRRDKKPLPPISNRSRDLSESSIRATPFDKIPELSLYTYFNDKAFVPKEPTSAHKFFNMNKSVEPPSPTSPMPDMISKSVSIQNDNLTPKMLINSSLKTMGKHCKWEMMERIESFEIKKVQKANSIRTFQVLNDEFYLWQQCFSEIIPLLKLQSLEAAKAVSIINEHILTLFTEINCEFSTQKKSYVADSLALQKKINDLQSQILKLQGASEEKLKIQRLESDKIKSEINEIFGSDDGEYQLFRQKANKLYNIKSGATTEVLNDLYQEMSKEIEIPLLRAYDGNLLKPEELESGLLKNFKLLQRNTAHRVFKIIESRVVKRDQYSQTENTFIEPNKLEEANNKIEKLERHYQEVLELNQKINAENIHQSNEIKLLQNERNETLFNLSKLQREVEELNEQAQRLIKENSKLKSTIEKNNNELNRNLKEKEELESKIDTQFARISQLVLKVDECEKFLLDNNERIKDLEVREEELKTQGQSQLEIPSGINNLKSSSSLSGSQHPSSNLLEISDDIRGSITNTENRDRSESISTTDQNTRAASRLSEDTTNSSQSNYTLYQSPKVKLQELPKVDESPVQTPQLTPHNKNSENASLLQSSETSDMTEYKKSYKERRKIQNLSNPESAISEEEYGMRMAPKWDYKASDIVSPSSSSPTNYVSDPYLRVNNKGRLYEDGKQIYLNDQSVSTKEFIEKNAIENSKCTQFNWENPDADYDSPKIYDSNGNLIYLMPFNPNNIYGLRGDSYHHTLKRVFQAQPVIPEMQESIYFKQNYKLEKDRNEKSKKSPKKRDKLPKNSIISPYQ